MISHNLIGFMAFLCVCSILYIKERDIMLSGSYESVLRVWNMPTYQCIAVIENLRWRTANGIYQIDNNRVIIG